MDHNGPQIDKKPRPADGPIINRKGTRDRIGTSRRNKQMNGNRWDKKGPIGGPHVPETTGPDPRPL